MFRSRVLATTAISLASLLSHRFLCLAHIAILNDLSCRVPWLASQPPCASAAFSPLNLFPPASAHASEFEIKGGFFLS
jgi:hypothetical protein